MKIRRKRVLILCACSLLLGLSAAEPAAPSVPEKTAEKKAGEKKSANPKKPEDAKRKRFNFLKKLDRKKATSPTESIDSELVKPEQTTGNKEILQKVQQIPSRQFQPKQEKVAQRMHFYDDFIMVNGDEEIQVSMVFNNAPLVDVIPSFADVLGFSFVADSALKGVITLNIDQKMQRRDLWNTFDRMLNLSGAGVTVDGSLLRIVALDKLARQPDSRLSAKADGELFYYALKSSNAKEIAQQIKPFLGISGVVVELSRSNAILIADDRANMPKIKQILETVDRSGKANWKRKVFICRNILPSRLVEELQAVLPVLGFNVFLKTDRLEQPGSIQLSGVDRLQLLIVSAATEEAIREIDTWVTLLDSTDSLDQERVFVYKVRHGKAMQLGQALSVIFDIQGSILSVDSTTGKTKLENLNTVSSRGRTQQNNQNSRNNTSASSATNTQTDKASNIFDTPVRVFADGSLNRLIVRTTPRTYASIKALLNRLDVVPAQVLLQVLVVEVTLNDATNFGIEFSTENQVGGANSLLGSNFSNLVPAQTAHGTGTQSGTQQTQTGYTWLISDPNNPENKFAYIRALAGNTNIKVVSSPQVLVTSDREAKIQVGEDIPYLSQGITNTQSSGSMLQNYQYRETGVILTITPQITSNDYIALKVNQELSAAENSGITVVSGSDSNEVYQPTFTKRIVETSMTIPNGRTMIIGGLIQEKVSDEQNSLPIINQIPVLSRLLGSTDASVKRTELLVMITGYIITEKSPVEDMIARYNSSIRALNEFQNTLGNAEKKEKPKEESWFDSIFRPKRLEGEYK